MSRLLLKFGGMYNYCTWYIKKSGEVIKYKAKSILLSVIGVVIGEIGLIVSLYAITLSNKSYEQVNMTFSKQVAYNEVTVDPSRGTIYVNLLVTESPSTYNSFDVSWKPTMNRKYKSGDKISFNNLKVDIQTADRSTVSQWGVRKYDYRFTQTSGASEYSTKLEATFKLKNIISNFKSFKVKWNSNVHSPITTKDW